ncbi:protein FAR1-RELATED SEQUENCE 5-like [Apium graveolens]|uniref:protein FAR1-RELATED SEQUENCE 5-like n=1 Tax=Apium graveolens TaxID=4045 RepID=UPI003D7A85E9
MNSVQRERHVNTATRSLIRTLYDSGIRNCQVMNVIGNIHGDNDKVGFNVQHVRNVIRDERKKRFDISDAQARYAMPFVPFTEVNHHYQSVIFGFALMRDKHASTFKWILHTWLEGVGNKPPMTITTDQDQAMASAIADVLPNPTHLLCSWHISQKFPEKLAHRYSNFPEFKTFNHYIYKSLTEDIF